MTGSNFVNASYGGCMTATPSCAASSDWEVADARENETADGETECNAEVAAECALHDDASAAYSLIPPLPFVIGLFGMLKVAWRWFTGARPKMQHAQDDSRLAPALPPADKTHANCGKPSQAVSRGSRAQLVPGTIGRDSGEYARTCWNEVGENRLRVMIFRGENEQDSIRSGLITASMIYFMEHEKDVVPPEFRDAPHCLIDCEQLLHPSLPQASIARGIVAAAQRIDEIMQTAAKRSAVLVLNGADLLSRSGIAAPINGIIANALKRNEVHLNLLRIATVTTPGWEFCDLSSAHKENGMN